MSFINHLLSEHDITLRIGKSQITYSPNVHVGMFIDKVILSNEITSALAWFDLERGTVEFKSYQSRLTADQKVEKYKKIHDNGDQFEEEKRKMEQEITFMPPYWCEVSQCFYRFSYLENQEVSKGSVEIIREIYLTSYDKELNKLWEISLPELTKTPGRHFAKDGKIWMFENLRDEMGFFRLGIHNN